MRESPRIFPKTNTRVLDAKIGIVTFNVDASLLLRGKLVAVRLCSSTTAVGV